MIFLKLNFFYLYFLILKDLGNTSVESHWLVWLCNLWQQRTSGLARLFGWWIMDIRAYRDFLLHVLAIVYKHRRNFKKLNCLQMIASDFKREFAFSKTLFCSACLLFSCTQPKPDQA